MEKTVIQDFLDERKAGWLKTRLKNTMSDEELAVIEADANERYAIAHWVLDAAKRAKQLSFVSHSGKFSHPSAKVSPLIANTRRQADGYVRSGNVSVEMDVLGNAAAMDVHKFLSLELEDGQTVLAHIEASSDTIQQQLRFNQETFAEIRDGLLAVKRSASKAATSERVKQVYFPLDDGGYHLLSVLTPSGVMFALKERINQQRFSDDAKVARKARREGEASEQGFQDLYGLTAIGFGGSKPQNISVLNSRNGGVAYLLPSMPPKLQRRRLRLPTQNFFKQTIRLRELDGYLSELTSLLDDSHSEKRRNNRHLRRSRDRIVSSIIWQVLQKAQQVRQTDAGWSDREHYSLLPQPQKLWLDQQYHQRREEETDWINDVKTEFTRWLLNAVGDKLGDAILLGDEQWSYFADQIDAQQEVLL